MSEPLIYETHGPVALITLNRPGVRNALTDSRMLVSLPAALERAGAEPGVRVLVITGAGTAFSSGGNIKDMRSRSGMFGGDAVALRDGYRQGVQRIPRTLHELEIPTIAAVNGPAVGAGLDLALACDLRLAGEAAVFAASFVRLGIAPGDGGAWFLPRILGPARAARMLFTGEALDAAMARDWGLVSQVFPQGELMAGAMALAERIAGHPRTALAFTKRLLRESADQSLRSHLELAAALQAIAHGTPEHARLMEALAAAQNAS